MTNKPPTDVQDLADRINQLVEQLTSSRGEALADARSLQMAGQGLLQREERRLSHKLGQDHPRVQQLRQRRESMLGNIQRLSAEKQITEIRPPELQENQALVHGRVLDERAQGIQGMQISLVDEKGSPLPHSTATTASSGYYALKLDPGQISGDQKGLLTVSTVTGRVVYRAEEPVEIKSGRQTTVEIQLNRRELSKPGPPGGEPPPAPEIAWMIQGRVTDQAENALAGLTVQVTSPEIKLDRPLASTTTNRNGLYRMRIKPDPEIEGLTACIKLTVSVIDEKGEQIYTSKEEILFKPGEEFRHDIQIRLPGRKTKAR